MADPLNCLVPHFDAVLPGAPSGPLAGLTFATKDIFDIAGHVTGCGNPDWLRTHGQATKTAPVVEKLLAAGATMTGKTITDELAYSLNGQNFHYGTPVNSNAPGHIPGGSSSGSAAAVAGKLVDLALGSDTGGSVRGPAAMCGIYGIRPTHDRIPLEGIMPLAVSFDTIGWFTGDAALLERVGEVLLGEDIDQSGFSGLLLAEDGFALAEPAVGAALSHSIKAAALELGGMRPVDVGSEGGGLAAWMTCFRTIQATEIWRQHGAWIERTKPVFGPEIAQRFQWAKSVAEAPSGDVAERRRAFARRMDKMLAGGGALCIPTIPSGAPLVGLAGEASQKFRDRTLSLTCIAGLAKLPQVTLPVASVDGCPVGLSLIGRRGSDRQLLSLVTRIASRLA
jgi:amidase